jgi:hypothetical protein
VINVSSADSVDTLMSSDPEALLVIFEERHDFQAFTIQLGRNKRFQSTVYHVLQSQTSASQGHSHP